MPGPARTARPVPPAPNRSGTRSRRPRRRRRWRRCSSSPSARRRSSGSPMATSSSGGPSPSPLRARIVTVAESQLGYRTDPADSYCNKFSAYWDAGTATCGIGPAQRGVVRRLRRLGLASRPAPTVTYELTTGDLNAASASFYVWGVDHGTWHPAGRRLHAPAGRRRRLRPRHGHPTWPPTWPWSPATRRVTGARRRQRRRRPHRVQRRRGRHRPVPRPTPTAAARHCRATPLP